jgi:hypothetical protein
MLQIDVGVSGWMCLLVVYNFSMTAGAIGKTAVSQELQIRTWNASMAAEH